MSVSGRGQAGARGGGGYSSSTFYFCREYIQHHSAAVVLVVWSAVLLWKLQVVVHGTVSAIQKRVALYFSFTLSEVYTYVCSGTWYILFCYCSHLLCCSNALTAPASYIILVMRRSGCCEFCVVFTYMCVCVFSCQSLVYVVAGGGMLPKKSAQCVVWMRGNLSGCGIMRCLHAG